MMLLMLATMTILVSVYISTNESMQRQMGAEQQQAKEQIAITGVGINSAQEITNITISNTGTIEVTIRALYRQVAGHTSLLEDPLTSIAQGSNKTLDLTSFGLSTEANSVFIAATQRGTKSIGVNEIQLEYGETPGQFNTTALTIGSLVLTFDSLNWASCNPNGNNLSPWQLTWTIPTGYCAWRVNLTNVDPQERDIFINQYSGFTISLVNSPSTATWYMDNTQQTLSWNQTSSIVFLWNSVGGNQAQTAGSPQTGVNNVFLTLFGSYSNGEPFAQTIPFEAITVTK